MTTGAITNATWGIFECELCGRRVDKLYHRMDLKWICEDCVGGTLRPQTFVQGTISVRWSVGHPESDGEAG